MLLDLSREASFTAIREGQNMIEIQAHNKAINAGRIPGRQAGIEQSWDDLREAIDRLPGWTLVFLLLLLNWILTVLIVWG